MTVFKLTVLSSSLYIIVHLFVKHSVHGLSLLGAVHILRKHILGSLNTLGGVVSAW